MGDLIDIAGQRFGRMTVIEYVGYRPGGGRWRCRCDCGELRVVASQKLRNGRTVSCGCWRLEMFKRLRPNPYRGVKLTQARALVLFEYHQDGYLLHRTARGGVKAGDKAGCDFEGYRCVTADSVHYLEHRVIFLMHHGYMPDEIDHADLNRSNGRIKNLREASRSQNSHNRRVSVRSRSGVKGVFQIKGSKKFYAKIRKDGRIYSLGGYFTADEASAAYARKARELYGEFARWK